MEKINTQEIQQLRNFCQAEGLHHSEKREAVLEAFLKLGHHVTEDMLWQYLQQKQIPVDLKTVHNSLDLFLKAGLARKFQLEDGTVCFDHVFAHRHHDHLICRRCSKIIEFSSAPLEKLQESIAQGHDFTIEDHSLAIYGICGECSAKAKVGEKPALSKDERQHLLPLSRFKPGQSGQVKELNCGPGLCRKLAAMGIRPGMTVTKVSAMFLGGPVVISINRRQLALGNGMADKILLETIK